MLINSVGTFIFVIVILLCFSPWYAYFFFSIKTSCLKFHFWTYISYNIELKIFWLFFPYTFKPHDLLTLRPLLLSPDWLFFGGKWVEALDQAFGKLHISFHLFPSCFNWGKTPSVFFNLPYPMPNGRCWGGNLETAFLSSLQPQTKCRHLYSISHCKLLQLLILLSDTLMHVWACSHTPLLLGGNVGLCVQVELAVPVP